MPTQPPLLNPPPSRWRPFALAVAVGALGWIVTSALTDRKEAWDSPFYFQVAYPAFALITALFGYFSPGRPWLAPLGIALGQALVAFVKNPTANLLPLGLIVFVVLAAPLMVAGVIGTRLRRWREQ